MNKNSELMSDDRPLVQRLTDDIADQERYVERVRAELKTAENVLAVYKEKLSELIES